MPSECVFVILAAPRTGSTMVESMLNSHPDAVVGGELLNDVLTEQDGEILWPEKSAQSQRVLHGRELKQLRRKDPVAFLSAIGDMARSEGYRVFGFKMLYAHGTYSSTATEYLANLPDLRIIHLKRRNRLRRFVSLKRAMTSGVWTLSQGEERAPEKAPMDLDFDECVEDFETIAKGERGYDEFFSRRTTLEVFYEDLTADLDAWSSRIQEFLTLPLRKLQVPTRRMGGGSLRDAIANYDDLANRFADTEWAEQFTE
jgi:LPS sulfotransferase NodH